MRDAFLYLQFSLRYQTRDNVIKLARTNYEMVYYGPFL